MMLKINEIPDNWAQKNLLGYRVAVLDGGLYETSELLDNGTKGKLQDIKYHCGHIHKTVSAAEKCFERLAKWDEARILPVYRGYKHRCLWAECT